MENMTLREVCTALGVSRRAVQGYENESLVTATGKNNRGYLLYDSEAQERIKKIKLYQDMGFSRKQLKEIIDDYTQFPSFVFLLLLLWNRFPISASAFHLDRYRNKLH